MATTNVNTAAYGAGKTTEVLVSNVTATALPTTPLVGRRWMHIQNLGPNAIYITLDGSNPVVDKSLKIANGTAITLDIGDSVAVKALAATAAQVTAAATVVSELA